MSHEQILSQIQKALPQVKMRLIRESIFIEDASHLTEVATFLRDNEELKLDFLSSVTGSDYLTYLESVYHFYSTEKRTGPVTVRVRTDRDNPKVPSLVPIYRGAEYQEREAYDMYGIEYVGHPDPRRIFMWEGFDGFPMRKDYIQEDSESLEAEDIAWCEARGIQVPDDVRAKEKPAEGSSEAAGEGEKP